MGKKLKKKAPKKKKVSQKNYDSGRIDWGLGIRSSSDSESDSESLSGMNILSSDVPAIFPFGRVESDSETTELALMGEQERNNVRKLLKDKEDQCQKLQHEVTSLRKEVNETSTIIKKLKDSSSYFEKLEATILSLKGDLE